MEKCKVCEKEFTTIKNVLTHCSRAKGHIKAKEYKLLFLEREKFVKCEICGDYFTDVIGLFKHVTRMEKLSRVEYMEKFPESKELYKSYMINLIKNSVIINENGCWIWTKSMNQEYAEYGGKPAHRLSYQIFKGDIPEGMLICHECDTPSCVNPDHLYCGTQQTNMDDMRNRGRSLVGDKNPAKRLEVRNRIKQNNPMNSLENRIKVSVKTKGINKNHNYNYEITDPNGNILKYRSLYKFCKEYDMDYKVFLQLSSGKIENHNGWKCTREEIIFRKE